ncbi:dihydrofolate reductase [Anaerotruncus sp. AF02-27]|uniref:NAD(P)-dependent oxidoreductase n=1 Tax=Anaerotruncus TaxID=244127 RepID=UPI000E488933|nr:MULTISPECIES: NAD(P)-dependent oxidoreductase [Anaerotruncus]RGX54701.1 dihydrofolate reductase [Anaerotruncus sp. AF02-27]
MFDKLTAIEPVSLLPWAQQELFGYARQVCMFSDVPANDDEILRRIGDSDAVLVSYTSRIGASVIRRCPNLKYIGMCCSLYSEESANVDIACARELGVKVLGIRDYGDRGVVEYVLHELIDLLHGFDRPRLYEQAAEITGLKVGIVGLGTSGRMIADALQLLGANISYYCRSPKPDAQAQGMRFTPLHELLRDSQVVCTCLNKNVLLLGAPEFAQLGSGKILFNTSIGPGFDPAALEQWVRGDSSNYFFCDTRAAAGSVSDGFFALPNVTCRDVSAGRTAQAAELLSKKVLDNLRSAARQA